MGARCKPPFIHNTIHPYTGRLQQVPFKLCSRVTQSLIWLACVTCQKCVTNRIATLCRSFMVYYYYYYYCRCCTLELLPRQLDCLPINDCCNGVDSFVVMLKPRGSLHSTCFSLLAYLLLGLLAAVAMVVVVGLASLVGIALLMPFWSAWRPRQKWFWGALPLLNAKAH